MTSNSGKPYFSSRGKGSFLLESLLETTSLPFGAHLPRTMGRCGKGMVLKTVAIKNVCEDCDALYCYQHYLGVEIPWPPSFTMSPAFKSER